MQDRHDSDLIESVALGAGVHYMMMMMNLSC